MALSMGTGAGTKTIRISVNGAAREVDEDSTIADLLTDVRPGASGFPGIAVALNDAVVRRTSWSDVSLGEGDRVEIVTARQGG